MKVDVYASNTHLLKRDANRKTVVVIDTLRATSTIITAMANGCHQVVPVVDVEAAMDLKITMAHNNAVLGGERGGEKLPGFDLGNSPLEYTKKAIGGHTLILSTTNGTASIQKASDARRLFIGGLINASAVADALCAWGDDFIILCSGTGGRFSTDDVLTAGCILSILRQRGMALEVDDLGIVAESLYLSGKKDILKYLSNTRHFNILLNLGREEDLVYCLSQDIHSVVPEYRDGRIVLD